MFHYYKFINSKISNPCIAGVFDEEQFNGNNMNMQSEEKKTCQDSSENKLHAENLLTKWIKKTTLEGGESLLQLHLSEDETHLLGTTALGFCIWSVSAFFVDNSRTEGKRIDLKLPTGVRNISVKLLHSNSIILSKDGEYAVAGVR